ncbi:MAG: hypothetical protein E3J35_02440 [Methanomassiliicoccales archaeon]|nr:MAG: hypothetical protein E3J35_02440 [Methanomassiliicoccales archaeon]
MKRRIPAPFKVFRPLRLAIAKGVKEELRWRNDKRGVYGIELRLDGRSCIDFDFSDWIAEDGTIRRLLPTESISPIQIDDFQVGIRGIQASSITAKWYDTTFTPRLIIEGWRRHGDLIPFDEIVPNLIYRDIVLMHDYRYTCILPSWDVSLTLPAYLLLCEDIPGFEARLSDVTELGDQIRKSLKDISARRRRGKAVYQNLELFLEKLHALEDELSLALNVLRSGCDVRFGERGGPDLYVNSIPCEQKSRFPMTDGRDIEVRVPEGFTIVDVYRLFVLEVKQTKRAFRKSGIFFNNLSRTGAGMAYTEAVDRERKKGKPASRGIAEMQTSLRVMIHLALDLQKEWGKVIVPYTRYVGPDSRYTIPIPIPLTKYQEVMELERPHGRNRSSPTSSFSDEHQASS